MHVSGSHQTFIAGMLAANLICCAVLSQESSSKQETQPAGALPDLAPIMERVSEIRGLEFRQDVPASKQTVEEFKQYMLRQIEEELPQEAFRDATDGLLRLGLLHERIDLGEAMVDAMASQAGAYYDPETEQFYYLMTDMDPQLIETMASHELVHALQDQHFELDEIIEELREVWDVDGVRNDDRTQAIRFLIEGEATYVMNLYQITQAGQPAAIADMATRQMARMDITQTIAMSKAALKTMAPDSDLAKAMEAAESIPPYIFEALVAAYIQGAGFAVDARKAAGGWEGLNDVWRDLPSSTEQTLHPEKYTGDQRDEPTRIVLPEFSSLTDAGWETIDTAIHGEMYLAMLLREQGVESAAATEASIGWDGDIYRAFRNEAGDVAIAFATTWDSEADAQEFYKAYLTAVEGKYPDIANATEENGVVKFECGDGLGNGRIILRGKEVFAVEGFSADVTADVMDELLAIEIDRIGMVPRKQLGAADGEWIHLQGFSFMVPKAWSEVPPEHESRVVQFELPNAEGDDEDVDFIVYHFGNRHGGGEELIQANMDRWQEQFDWEGEVKRGKRTSNGIDVYDIDITGTYKAETFPGSGQYRNDPGYRMLGAIVLAPTGSFYFRVVGPKATVTGWQEAWEAALESIKPSM